jgi:Flp pilus assembly pilin Flp
MKKLFRNSERSERGQTFAEYNIMMTAVFILTIGVLGVMGEGLRNPFCVIADLMNWPACAELQPDWGMPDAPEDPEECVALQEEQGGSQCEASEDCEVLPGVNAGDWYSGGETIDNFVIKAGKEYHIYQSGITFDGCYEVDLDGPNVSWIKLSGGSDCQDVSHMQSWFTPLCTED